MGTRGSAVERARAPRARRAPVRAAAMYKQAWTLAAGFERKWMMVPMVEGSHPAALCVCFCIESQQICLVFWGEFVSTVLGAHEPAAGTSGGMVCATAAPGVYAACLGQVLCRGLQGCKVPL